MQRGRRRGALRGGGALPQPALRRPASRRAAGGRPARGRHGRRDRLRRRAATAPPCRSSRSATARWSTATRSTSRTSAARTGRRSLEAFCLEYYGSSPSVPPQIVVPRGLGRPGGARRVPVRAARLAGRGARAERGEKRRLQELATQNARARARGGAARSRAAAAAPGRGARGAARGAEPREPADADRVLRHLDTQGAGAGRLDGRLPGRGRRRRRTTASSASAAGRARTTSPRWPR